MHENRVNNAAKAAEDFREDLEGVATEADQAERKIKKLMAIYKNLCAESKQNVSVSLLPRIVQALPMLNRPIIVFHKNSLRGGGIPTPSSIKRSHPSLPPVDDLKEILNTTHQFEQ